MSDHGGFVAHPDELAVLFVNLGKRVHIGADIVFIGIIAANALEIVFENLIHEGFFYPDFFLGQRKNGKTQFSRSRNAAFFIGEHNGDGYVFGIFADHRTVHLGACRVVDIGRTDDRLVVRGNAYRDKRAVDAEIARGRILDIARDRINAVGFGKLFTGIRVVQTGFCKAFFEFFRKRSTDFLQGAVV